MQKQLFRWSIGFQDTTKLSDFALDKYKELLWLTKVSILSFQKWFNAEFVLLYNGPDFEYFIDHFHKIEPFVSRLRIIQQKEFDNPYHFVPFGVWWKWIPFRLDITKTEISVDTDIICINKPESWFEWINSNNELLIAPERYERVVVNTCGDFYDHPLLFNKTPYNCGVVGQKQGIDFGARFFDITKQVKMGETHDSMFITEQGAINLWIRSLEMEGIKHTVLDFKANAWLKDFVYFMQQGIQVETIHATMWHKKIVQEMKNIIERKILDNSYSTSEFLNDILQNRGFKQISKALILNQVQQ